MTIPAWITQALKESEIDDYYDASCIVVVRDDYQRVLTLLSEAYEALAPFHAGDDRQAACPGCRAMVAIEAGLTPEATDPFDKYNGLERREKTP